MSHLRALYGYRCRSGNSPSRCAALVSLADAREEALANRKLARSGGYTLADKRRVQLHHRVRGHLRRIHRSTAAAGWRCRIRSATAGTSAASRKSAKSNPGPTVHPTSE